MFSAIAALELKIQNSLNDTIERLQLGESAILHSRPTAFMHIQYITVVKHKLTSLDKNHYYLSLFQGLYSGRKLNFIGLKTDVARSIYSTELHCGLK